MPALTFYLGSPLAGNWANLREGTPFNAATTGTGWVVSTGATLRAAMESGAERASTVFVGTTDPDGTLDTVLFDAMRTELPLSGDFVAGNWELNCVFRAVTNGGAQDGRVYIRVFKGSAADGSNAIEITSGALQGGIATNISTTADFLSQIVWAAPAINLVNEYLFFQIAWERTGAGGMATADVLFRTGSASTTGTRFITANFVVTPQIEMQGTAAGAGSAQASVDRIMPLAGSAPGVGSSEAPLASAVAMIGSATGTGTPSGALSGIIPIAGSINGLGQTIGLLVRVVPIEGSVNGIGLTESELNQIISLIGSVTGIGVAIAEFEEEGGFITGAVIGIGSTTGSLINLRSISGDAAGTGEATGGIDRIMGIEGEAEGQGITQGTLDAVISMIGHALAAGQAIGNLGNISAFVLDIPPCPTQVRADPSANSVLLLPSGNACFVKPSATGTDIICLTPAEEEALANG